MDFSTSFSSSRKSSSRAHDQPRRGKITGLHTPSSLMKRSSQENPNPKAYGDHVGQFSAHPFHRGGDGADASYSRFLLHQVSNKGAELPVDSERDGPFEIAPVEMIEMETSTEEDGLKNGSADIVAMNGNGKTSSLHMSTLRTTAVAEGNHDQNLPDSSQGHSRNDISVASGMDYTTESRSGGEVMRLHKLWQKKCSEVEDLKHELQSIETERQQAYFTSRRTETQLRRDVSVLQKSASDLERRAKVAEEELEAAQHRAEWGEGAASAEKMLNDKLKDANESLQRQLQQIQAEKSHFEHENGRLKSKITELEEACAKQSSSLAEMTRDISEMGEELRDCRHALAISNSEVIQASERAHQIEQEAASVAKQSIAGAAAQAQLAQANRRVECLEADKRQLLLAVSSLNVQSGSIDRGNQAKGNAARIKQLGESSFFSQHSTAGLQARHLKRGARTKRMAEEQIAMLTEQASGSGTQDSGIWVPNTALNLARSWAQRHAKSASFAEVDGLTMALYSAWQASYKRREKFIKAEAKKRIISARRKALQDIPADIVQANQTIDRLRKALSQARLLAQSADTKVSSNRKGSASQAGGKHIIAGLSAEVRKLTSENSILKQTIALGDSSYQSLEVSGTHSQQERSNGHPTPGVGSVWNLQQASEVASPSKGVGEYKHSLRDGTNILDLEPANRSQKRVPMRATASPVQSKGIISTRSTIFSSNHVLEGSHREGVSTPNTAKSTGAFTDAGDGFGSVADDTEWLSDEWDDGLGSESDEATQDQRWITNTDSMDNQTQDNQAAVPGSLAWVLSDAS